MNEKTKKTALFLGALFVALIFLTSFMGGGNVAGGNSTSNKTKQNITAVFASGKVNGTVKSYGTSASIILLNRSFENVTNDILVGMEANNSISTYNQISNQFNIYLNTIDAYSLQKVLSSMIGNDSFELTSKEYVSLPSTSMMRVGSQSVPVSFGSAIYALNPTRLTAVNSTVQIYVNAIIAFQNGAYRVYNNNVTLRTA